MVRVFVSVFVFCVDRVAEELRVAEPVEVLVRVFVVPAERVVVSRLTVVVRPFASVFRIVVVVVPLFFTLVSTVVTGVRVAVPVVEVEACRVEVVPVWRVEVAALPVCRVEVPEVVVELV